METSWKVIVGERNGKQYCDGIVVAASYDSDLEFYRDYVVQTDGGVYGPKLTDAYVIATAPEMLKVLEDLTPKLAAHGMRITEITAVVRKARGGQ